MLRPVETGIDEGALKWNHGVTKLNRIIANFGVSRTLIIAHLAKKLAAFI
jgi:hypothetical protein